MNVDADDPQIGAALHSRDHRRGRRFTVCELATQQVADRAAAAVRREYPVDIDAGFLEKAFFHRNRKWHSVRRDAIVRYNDLLGVRAGRGRRHAHQHCEALDKRAPFRGPGIHHCDSS